MMSMIPGFLGVAGFTQFSTKAMVISPVGPEKFWLAMAEISISRSPFRSSRMRQKLDNGIATRFSKPPTKNLGGRLLRCFKKDSAF